MSISLAVVGKYRNGRRKVAGIHLSANSEINAEIRNNLLYRVATEITPNIEKFANIIVDGQISFQSSLSPTIHIRRDKVKADNLLHTVDSAIAELNKAYYSTPM